MLILYNDNYDPFLATDTQYVYLANYHNIIYDSLGFAIDSAYVASDTTMYLNYTDTYDVYEI